MCSGEGVCHVAMRRRLTRRSSLPARCDSCAPGPVGTPGNVPFCCVGVFRQPGLTQPDGTPLRQFISSRNKALQRSDGQNWNWRSLVGGDVAAGRFCPRREILRTTPSDVRALPHWHDRLRQVASARSGRTRPAKSVSDLEAAYCQESNRLVRTRMLGGLAEAPGQLGPLSRSLFILTHGNGGL
jgi:hypothetical protein